MCDGSSNECRIPIGGGCGGDPTDCVGGEFFHISSLNVVHSNILIHQCATIVHRALYQQ